MPREIKFRAWSNGVKSDTVARRKVYGEWVFPPQMLYDERPGDCLVWKSQGQNIEIMEYTGLKDRAGKEIYEGDFIHVPADEYEPEYKGEIKWYDGYWGFDEFYPDGTLCGALFLYSYHDFCEVIGNVWENPEILEGGTTA